MSDLKLSSILNMRGDFSTIRRTVAALAAQTAREHLELVIVAVREHVSTIPRDALQSFAGHQIIEVDALPSGADGWAQGIRRARAPVVVLSEDHGYPASNWAQTLIDAHAQGDYFAVSPALTNANPQTCTSWANFLLSFVSWYAPDAPHLVESGAGHNTSYKREPLLADYGDKLRDWLNPERVLHYDLIARGRKILLDSRTSVAHVNISLTRDYFGMSYAGGRVFGAARSATWGLGRRAIYAILFFLVPFLRLRRLLGQLNTPEKRRASRFFPSFPLIMLGLFCHALGEAVGYLFGTGSIGQKYVDYELNRPDYVIEAERQWMMDCAGIQKQPLV